MILQNSCSQAKTDPIFEIKIIIVDDNPFIWEGLKIIFILKTWKTSCQVMKECTYARAFFFLFFIQSLIECVHMNILEINNLTKTDWSHAKVGSKNIRVSSSTLDGGYLDKIAGRKHIWQLILNLLILFAFAAACFLVAIYHFSCNNSTKSFI